MYGIEIIFRWLLGGKGVRVNVGIECSLRVFILGSRRDCI